MLAYIACIVGNADSALGLKVDHTCWPTDPQRILGVTHIWPSCDPHAKVFLLKVMQNDMENIKYETTP